jgi:hypothetical protein
MVSAVQFEPAYLPEGDFAGATDDEAWSRILSGWYRSQGGMHTSGMANWEFE